MSATATSNSVNVMWTPVTGATHYELIFQGETFTDITKLAKLKEKLEPNTVYSFQVRGKNAGGAGPYSAVGSILTNPAIPEADGTATYDTVTITWNPVPGAISYDLVFDGITYSGLTGTSKQFIGLTQDTLYQYKICSNGVEDSSLYSAEKSIRTLVEPPDTPIEISAVSTSNTVTISWKKMPRATEYEILFDGELIEHGSTTFRKDGLEQDTEYTFQILAKNSAGKSPYSAVYTIRTKEQAPGMPANVKARWDGDAIVVSWDPSPYATSYDIKFDGVVYPGITGTSYRFTGIDITTSHSYQVCAVNHIGSSPYTSLQRIYPPPAVPDSVTSTANDKEITLSWPPVSGADGYDVTINGKTYHVTEPNFKLDSLIPNSNYQYKVSASNANGSGTSIEGSIKTAPNTPENITVDRKEDSLTFEWDRVPSASGYDLVVDGEHHTVPADPDGSGLVGGNNPSKTIDQLAP